MASLRDIRKRIHSVESTQKITRAMKMIAAARFRKGQAQIATSKPYLQSLFDLLAELTASTIDCQVAHPLCAAGSVERRLVVVMSSDRGLCGGLNTNVFKEVELICKKSHHVELVVIGRKAASYFARRPYPIWRKIDGFWQDFSFERAKELTHILTETFLAGQFDQVDMVFNVLKSAMVQKVARKQLLPWLPLLEGPPITTQSASDHPNFERKFEPEISILLQSLVPQVIEAQVYQACIHSLASEHGARMTAMDAASRNAADMIDQLTLNMNRVRQATITRELVEIISGAEAIK